MTGRLGLAQCGYPADGDVLSQMRRYMADAAARGVDLLVFPENVMHSRKLDASGLKLIAEPVDGAFESGVAAAAREFGLWVVFTMAEARTDGTAPYNTAVVVDAAGELRGAYRKCHLYDAHGERESDRMSAGDAFCAPIDSPVGKLGLCICYDLRFPEISRELALAGAQVVLYPTAWHDGPEKTEHWRTLLRARAIENECFVAGACRAGEGYVGASLVADPLGRVIASVAGNDEALVVCDIDTDAIERARDAMPVFEHRRQELYR
jgi:predicted amidohydrolase